MKENILLKYRPEVDGLRAVAVGAVIAYHALIYIGDWQVFESGFLGVDVFFVISGYLIASLIMSEYGRTGSFKLATFFERRIRRLLPALLVMILAASLFARLFLLPAQANEFSLSAIWSAFFLSNFYWMETVTGGYFATPALLQPLLHTWSLGVEAQFYLVFAPLFALLYLLYRYRPGRLTPILLVTAFLSLVLAELELDEQVYGFAFYMLPTRLWELLAGALLATANIQGRFAGTRPIFMFLPALGAVAIAASMLLVDLRGQHPGLVTLPTVLGTALIIGFAHPREPVTRILSSKLFVFVGLGSYSLYLWHYPMFAFVRIMGWGGEPFNLVLLVALLSTASFLTYKFVEKPFRNRGKISLRTFVPVAAVSMGLIVAGAQYPVRAYYSEFPNLKELYEMNGPNDRFLRNEDFQIINQFARRAGFEPGQVGGPQEERERKRQRREHEAKTLWFEEDPVRKKVLVIGDSIGEDTFEALWLNRRLFRNAQFAFYYYVLDYQDQDRTIDGKYYKPEHLLSALNFRAADIILISHLFHVDNPRENRRNTDRPLAELIKFAKSEGKEVLVASSSPQSWVRGRGLPFDLIAYGEIPLPSGQRPDSLSKEELIKEINRAQYAHLARKMRGTEEPLEVTDARIRRIAEENGAKYLDKFPIVCNEREKTCTGLTPEGFKAIFDYAHYTLRGSEYFGRKMYETDWLGLGR